MRAYVKIIILVAVFVVLLLAVLGLHKAQTNVRRETRLAQTTSMFPGLEANQVLRLAVNSLQNQSLLLRKQAGVWEVTEGKDILGEIMARSQETEETPPAEEPPVSTQTDEAVEEFTEEAEPESQAPAAEEPAPPQNPRDDPGPAGDPFRLFYKADPDKVGQMVDAIVNMPQGQLVTGDTSKQSTLGVLGPIVGIEVIAYDAQMNELADIIIGNQGAGMSSTYVRKPDQDQVYEVPQNLAMIFGINIMSLRDRNIFTAAPETINTVSIRNNSTGNIISLSRSEGSWAGTDAEGNQLDLDAAKLDSLLGTLGTLSANSFVDPNQPPRPPAEEVWDEADPYMMLTPNAVISFTTADGAAHTLIVGRLQGTTYYCAVENNLFDVFRISKTTIDSLTPTPEALAPSELPEGTETLDSDIVSRGEIEELNPAIVPVQPPGDTGGE